MKCSVDPERSNNSITIQPNIVNNINSKLTLVTEKINAESERKLIKKALNVIIFNVPENCNSPSVYTIENSKKRPQLNSNSLSSNKLTETELNTLYRVGKYNSNKIRLVIVKLRT